MQILVIKKNNFMEKIVKVGYGKVNQVSIGGDLPLAFVGGPCAIESREHALIMAEKIAKICNRKYNHGYINLVTIKTADLPLTAFMVLESMKV